MNLIKSTTQKTAQAIAREVRDQSSEILKSTTYQISPQQESPSKPASAPKEVGPNPLELKQKEQALLNKWRARIGEIQAEEARAGRERVQSQEAWRAQQEDLMKEPEKEEQVFVEAQSKPKTGSQDGAQTQIRREQQKHELGRGAKN